MLHPLTDQDSRTLALYGTDACHLCEEAIAILQQMTALQGWLLEWIDIADDEELLERYGAHIPVLRWPAGGVRLDWPFVAEDVLTLLAPALSRL